MLCRPAVETGVSVRAVLFDFDFTLGDSADAIVHCSRGRSVMPVTQVVSIRYAALVAECGLTSVKVNGASPQLDTLTDALVLLPTARSPKVSVSALMQMRDAACAGARKKQPTSASRMANGRGGNGGNISIDRGDSAALECGKGPYPAAARQGYARRIRCAS